MTLGWRIGPLRFAIRGVTAPADWNLDDGAIDLSIDAADQGRPATERVPIATVKVARAGSGFACSRSGGFSAVVDLAAAVATYSGDIGPPYAIFESFLRVVAGARLLRDGGALLHAASIATNGVGYAFCGLSGAGKTTLVAGSADGDYLSDDQTIVARGGSLNFEVWGSPFSGLAARRAAPVAYPLGALVLLSSDRSTRTALVKRSDHARAAAELLRHVCSFEQCVDEAEHALNFVTDLLGAVPVFSLTRHIDTPLDEIVRSIDSQLLTRQAA